jgi:ureidoacrylate peracid hydrolase
VGQAVATPAAGEGRILVRDAWNTAILEELTPEAADIVVAKQRFIGFYNTELDTILMFGWTADAGAFIEAFESRQAAA